MSGPFFSSARAAHNSPRCWFTGRRRRSGTGPQMCVAPWTNLSILGVPVRHNVVGTKTGRNHALHADDLRRRVRPREEPGGDEGRFGGLLLVRGDGSSGRAAGRHRLRPASDATTVRVRGEEVLLSDGPFAETREQMGGYDLIECENLDDAIEIASRHPVAKSGAIEVRPLWE